MEVLDVTFEGFTLCLGASVLGLSSSVATTHIHDVSAHSVVTCSTIGNFPRVNQCVLVVLNKSFHTPVKMYHVRVAHLLPATPSLAYRGSMPVAYLRSTYLTSFGRGGAVDYKVK